METTGVAALVLAAGRSSRFGANKLLTEVLYNGVKQPLILHSLAPWLGVFEQIHLITQTDDQHLTDVCQSVEDRINFIKAETAELGMGHTIAAGIDATSESEGWLIGLADMPMLKPDVLKMLVTRLKQGADISAPFYHGKRGHPVAFSSQFRQNLMGLTGDIGARSILQNNQAVIEAVEVDTDSILMDIDTQADISLLKGR